MSTRISFTKEEIEWLVQAASEYAGQIGWDETYSRILRKLDKGSKRVSSVPDSSEEAEKLKKLVPNRLRKVLEEEGILDKYIINIIKCNKERSWKECARCGNVSGAFVWDATEEGHEYWKEIENKIILSRL